MTRFLDLVAILIVAVLVLLPQPGVNVFPAVPGIRPISIGWPAWKMRAIAPQDILKLPLGWPAPTCASISLGRRCAGAVLRSQRASGASGRSPTPATLLLPPGGAQAGRAGLAARCSRVPARHGADSPAVPRRVDAASRPDRRRSADRSAAPVSWCGRRCARPNPTCVPDPTDGSPAPAPATSPLPSRLFVARHVFVHTLSPPRPRALIDEAFAHYAALSSRQPAADLALRAARRTQGARPQAQAAGQIETHPGQCLLDVDPFPSSCDVSGHWPNGHRARGRPLAATRPTSASLSHDLAFVAGSTASPGRTMLIIGAGVMGCLASLGGCRRADGASLLLDRGSPGARRRTAAGILARADRSPRSPALLSLALASRALYPTGAEGAARADRTPISACGAAGVL